MRAQTRQGLRSNGRPRGDITGPARMAKMRQERRRLGWQAVELWLPPEDAALVADLKQPGESLTALIGRALRSLKTQGASSLSYEERLRLLITRMWAMRDDEKLFDQDIANRFNAERLPTLTGKGRWHGSTVGKLLKTYPRGG
jgi:hypothetical protein